MRKESTSLEQRADLLESTRWARDFQYQQLHTLARYLESYEAPAGTVIFKEGDEDTSMSVIVEGRVEIIKDDDSGRPKQLTVINRGDPLGEMALVDGQPRSATARALQETSLLLMTPAAFDRIVLEAPALAVALLRGVAARMSARLRSVSGRLVDLI